MRAHWKGLESRAFAAREKKRLAACLLAALGLNAVAASATASTLVVTDCTDDPSPPSGHVTLRSAVASANADSSIDTIDLNGVALSCSKITLANGELATSSFNLTILGPTNHGLIVAAAQPNNRVFHHSGGGTIAISNLFVEGAVGSENFSIVSGGCIYSAGSVRLTHTTVQYCNAIHGGGVYAVSSVQLHYSATQGNLAHYGGGVEVQSGNSLGYLHAYSSYIGSNAAHSCGGARAYNIVMTGSQVSDNLAGDNNQGFGGGLCGTNVSLSGTTVYFNYVDGKGAGIYGGTISLDYSNVTRNRMDQSNSNALAAGIFGSTVTITRSTIEGNYSNAAAAVYANVLSITNSTISGNRTKSGANISCNDLTLLNSTVAFNTIQTGTAGIFVASSAEIESSIVAKNAAGTSSGVDDLAIKTGASVTASNNLIVSSNYDTGSLTSDPQLAPLAKRGGQTRTLALLATSPAINAGANPDGLTTDQRGTGFARVVGIQADIGAYERQPGDDEIFGNGFD